MMEQIMTWIGPSLDVAAVGLLAAVLWRLGRDPGAAWGEREARLQTIFDDLRALVAQSEGLARDLDDKLAGRETRLRALLAAVETAVAGAAPTAPRERPTRVELRDDAAATAAPTVVTARAGTDGDPAATAHQIEALADAGTAVEEIARRVGVAVAEVRLVIGLKAARAARRRTAVAEMRAHG